MFIKESGNVRQFKSLGKLRELHVQAILSISTDGFTKSEIMNHAWQDSFKALKEAHSDGINYLIIKHDKAPLKRGQVSFGSRVRNLMRSHAAMPYIIRSKSIQMESAFIAAIRPKNVN